MLVKQALPFWTQNICTFLAENVINCRNIVNYSFLTFHYMHRGLEKKSLVLIVLPYLHIL